MLLCRHLLNTVLHKAAGLHEPIPAIIGWDAGYTLDISTILGVDTETNNNTDSNLQAI